MKKKRTKSPNKQNITGAVLLLTAPVFLLYFFAERSAQCADRNTKKSPQGAVKRTNLSFKVKSAVGIIPDIKLEFEIDNAAATVFECGNYRTARNTFLQHIHF